MIGRYALYRRRIVIVRAVDKDLNVSVQFMNKPDRKDTVPLKKLHLIERNGVNVFNSDDIPLAVRDSKYKWVIEFQTSNKRLINVINSGVQNRQVSNSFNQRSFYREKKRDLEGRIVVSLIEALNIKLHKNCNPYVKISI